MQEKQGIDWGSTAMDLGSLLDMMRGGGSAAGGSGGGSFGGMGTMGWIGAAIAAQMLATDTNPREIDGKPVGDIRSGDFLTEPWLDHLGARLGWEPTPGAAAAAGDKSKYPEAVDYWTDPIRGGLRYAMTNVAGEKATDVIDPVGWSVKSLGKLF